MLSRHQTPRLPFVHSNPLIVRLFVNVFHVSFLFQDDPGRASAERQRSTVQEVRFAVKWHVDNSTEVGQVVWRLQKCMDVEKKVGG